MVLERLEQCMLNDNKIKSYEDKVIQNEEECIKVLTNIVDYKPDVFISHNVHVEKNLLKSITCHKKGFPQTVCHWNGDHGLTQKQPTELYIQKYLPMT